MQVSTPNGLKHHGKVIGNEFHRKVDYNKDRMRIFDAWSIHPDALYQLLTKGIKTLVYTDKNGIVYKIRTTEAKKRGFEKTFGGGRTFYIPLNGGLQITRIKENYYENI